MTKCSSPRLSHHSTYVLDQTILAASEQCEDTPLPSALSLLTHLETQPQPIVEPRVELPVVGLAQPVKEDLQTPGSPELRHSRLAQRWFTSIAKREGSLLSEGSLTGETPSMVDLAQLCYGPNDAALSSPNSVEVSFDALLAHGIAPAP